MLPYYTNTGPAACQLVSEWIAKIGHCVVPSLGRLYVISQSVLQLVYQSLFGERPISQREVAHQDNGRKSSFTLASVLVFAV